MNHTPTPYVYRNGKIVVTEMLTPIAQMLRNDDEAQATGQFMARACNAHDDLVLAAKDGCLQIKAIAEACGIDYKNNETFKRLIRAIAKAEGA